MLLLFLINLELLKVRGKDYILSIKNYLHEFLSIQQFRRMHKIFSKDYFLKRSYRSLFYFLFSAEKTNIQYSSVAFFWIWLIFILKRENTTILIFLMQKKKSISHNLICSLSNLCVSNSFFKPPENSLFLFLQQEVKKYWNAIKLEQSRKQLIGYYSFFWKSTL